MGKILFFISQEKTKLQAEPFERMQELERNMMQSGVASGKKQHVINHSKNLFLKQSSHTDEKNMGSSCKNNRKSMQWYCQVCSLILTSKVQAQEHFFGKRHQNVVKSNDLYNQCNGLGIAGQRAADKKSLVVIERLRGPSKSSFDQNLGSGNEIIDSDDVIPPPAGRDNILETVIKSERKTFYSSDLSIYRTPSGKYYCQTCNVTVNSQAQFFQHSESRKHKQKANRMSLKMK